MHLQPKRSLDCGEYYDTPWSHHVFFVAGGVTFSWNTVNVYVTSLLCMQLILSWRVLHEAYRVHGALARARADRDEAGLR